MEEPRAVVEADLRLQLPNHFAIVGASMSGKTTLAFKLISNLNCFNPPPKRIIFWYDQYQEIYLTLKRKLAESNVEMLLFKGFNKNFTLENYEKTDGNTLLLIDDFSEETSRSTEIARFSTNGRHKGLSLMLIFHQLYSKHPESRTISQNIRYYFFLPSLRLESQLCTLGSQLGMKTTLTSAFKTCLNTEDEDSKYLLVDLGPSTHKLLRLRTRVHSLDYQYCFL